MKNSPRKCRLCSPHNLQYIDTHSLTYNQPRPARKESYLLRLITQPVCNPGSEMWRWHPSKAPSHPTLPQGPRARRPCSFLPLAGSLGDHSRAARLLPIPVDHGFVSHQDGGEVGGNLSWLLAAAYLLKPLKALPHLLFRLVFKMSPKGKLYFHFQSSSAMRTPRE